MSKINKLDSGIHTEKTKFWISEVFTSIQGEGKNIGLPCNFIRLSGCNLNCPWCDTDYKPKYELTKQEILVKLNPAFPVVITGGEPLIQKNILLLVDYLKAMGLRLFLESNGTMDKNDMYERFSYVAISPKWSSIEKTFFVCDSALKNADEIKVVVSKEVIVDVDSFLEKLNFMVAKANKLSYKYKHIYLQPEYSIKDEANKFILETILEHNLLYRVGIQLHKYLEVH